MPILPALPGEWRQWDRRSILTPNYTHPTPVWTRHRAVVCGGRRQLADRHVLPFPRTLSLHRRWCPSASHRPVSVISLLGPSFPLLPFPFSWEVVPPEPPDFPPDHCVIPPPPHTPKTAHMRPRNGPRPTSGSCKHPFAGDGPHNTLRPSNSDSSSLSPPHSFPHQMSEQSESQRGGCASGCCHPRPKGPHRLPQHTTGGGSYPKGLKHPYNRNPNTPKP